MKFEERHGKAECKHLVYVADIKKRGVVTVIVTWLGSVLLTICFSVNEQGGLEKEVTSISIPVDNVKSSGEIEIKRLEN